MSEAVEVPPSGAPRRRIALFVAIPLAVVLAAFVVLLATGDPAKDRLTRSPLVGKPAPPIAGITTGDRDISLESFRGRYVVVNFFASWCVPCVQEHPELVKFAERRRDGSASLLSVAYADSPTAVREFFTKYGGDWPVLAQKTTEFAVSYGVVSAPETFVIAPSGVVVAKFTGPVTADKLDEIIVKYGGSQK